jgi:hypothetical protein
MPCTPTASNDEVRGEQWSLAGLRSSRLQRHRPPARAAGVPGHGERADPPMIQTDPHHHRRLPRRRLAPGAVQPPPRSHLVDRLICNCKSVLRDQLKDVLLKPYLKHIILNVCD